VDGGAGLDGWKAAILLLGVCLALGGFIARYLWTSHHELVKKVASMELHNVANNVTKHELDSALKSFAERYIVPLTVEVRAMTRALAAQEIHVDRHRD
jgi:predicted negative regulator of RcsB-dependent stress response